MGVKEISFSDLLAEVIDNRGKTCPIADTGIPLIATNCIRNELLYPTYEKVRFVSQHTYSTWFRGHPRPGDIIFVNKATPGRVCLVPDPVDFCIAEDMVAVRANPKRVYPKFLFAALRSPIVQERIASMHVGTLIPHFKKGDFDKLLIPVPSREDQEFIGDVYYNLSAKIDLNRRMNATLEAMARALFKSWFVDFDPVRAKAEGRDTGLPRAITDLFPDGFEESAVGEVPKGWRIGTIGQVADHPRRTVQPGKIDATTPYIALEHMPRRCIALSDWGEADGLESNKFEFKKGEILFGKLRPYFHKVGVAPVDGVCSTDIVVVIPRRDEWFGFVLGHVSSDAFVEHTNAGSTGTKMPRTSWDEMARYSIVLPSPAIAAAFTEQIRPAIERILVSIHESRTLAALRDALLPKLISGEVRVGDAARFAAEVLS